MVADRLLARRPLASDLAGGVRGDAVQKRGAEVTNPCSTDRPDRTATCHGDCTKPEYMAFQQSKADNYKKRKLAFVVSDYRTGSVTRMERRKR
jgi:hypothetical protein